MRYSFALWAAAVLFCALANGAKTPTTEISVLVTNAQGTPVPHAEVTVFVMKGEKRKVMWQAHTGEDGFAKAPAEVKVPQGAIMVEARASEYAGFRDTYQVNEERKTIQVKMTSGLTQINVHVTTQGGKPIDHADVVVKFVKGRSIIELGRKLHTTWEMRTNQEGVAKVPEIPQGTILIQVIAKGYQTFGQSFDIDESQKTVEVKLNSPQEQYSAHQ